jgi:TRAP-type C4-dicarboxylate transport system substrate-binding protein
MTRTLTRRTALAMSAGALATPFVGRPGFAQTPEVTLRLHHFLPPSSNGQQRFLMPWAQKVETESGGRIKINIFPGMQLGGTPPQLFDQARDGVVDIVWTLPGNTPGRFPRIEVFELPFVGHRRAATNSRALMDFAPRHLAEEFREIHPICFWAHDHGLIHANRPVNTLDDMRGLKIRFASRQTGEMLRALGAQAIGMPAPQVSEALSQRVLDGTIFPWEVVPSLRIHELVRNHTEISGSPTLYTVTFVLAMNKARYDGLSAEAKRVLDANSGMVAAQMAGDAWDIASQGAMELVRGRGNTIISLPEAEIARFRQATAPVVENWVKAMQERNIDGQRLLDDARGALSRFPAA